MSIRLLLKKRPIRREFSLPNDTVRMIHGLPPDEAARTLYQLFKQLDAERHDSFWLEQITTWTDNEKGLQGKELGKWLPLMSKVQNLKPDADSILLSDFQAKLIWNRVNSAEWKLFGGVSPAFGGFLMDFAKTFGFHFSEEEPPEPTDDPHAAPVAEAAPNGQSAEPVPAT